jgi:hypothetical protein
MLDTALYKLTTVVTNKCKRSFNGKLEGKIPLAICNENKK